MARSHIYGKRARTEDEKRKDEDEDAIKQVQKGFQQHFLKEINAIIGVRYPGIRVMLPGLLSLDDGDNDDNDDTNLKTAVKTTVFSRKKPTSDGAGRAQFSVCVLVRVRQDRNQVGETEEMVQGVIEKDQREVLVGGDSDPGDFDIDMFMFGFTDSAYWKWATVIFWSPSPLS